MFPNQGSTETLLHLMYRPCFMLLASLCYQLCSYAAFLWAFQTIQCPRHQIIECFRVESLFFFRVESLLVWPWSWRSQLFHRVIQTRKQQTFSSSSCHMMAFASTCQRPSAWTLLRTIFLCSCNCSSLAGHQQPAFTNAPGITAVPFCVFMFKVRAELYPLCSLDGRFSRLPSDTSHRYTWHSCLCCDWWSIEGQRRNPQQTWTASHVWIFFFTKDQRAVGQEGASPDLFERQNNCSVCIERCL